jgi:cation transport ATPase
MRPALQTAVNLIIGDTWPKRRRVVYVSLMFCALVIAYCLGAATAIGDKAAIQTASDNAWWYGAAIIFAYVFGSIADDFDKRRTQRKLEEAQTAPEGE